MQLTTNFSLEELCVSGVAIRNGFDNRPSAEQKNCLGDLARNLLQPVRDLIARPLVVTSGYRCAELNRFIGGAPESQHMYGMAADIICPAMKCEKLFQKIVEMQLPFDQLILEKGRNGGWVHVSYDSNRQRKELLLASFPAGGGVHYQRLTANEAAAVS
jgi:hypothetical protein